MLDQLLSTGKSTIVNFLEIVGAISDLFLIILLLGYIFYIPNNIIITSVFLKRVGISHETTFTFGDHFYTF